MSLTIKTKTSERRDEDKPGKSVSPEEASTSREAKVKPVVLETAKLELPTTPKSSHKSESFKRKMEADNIVVTKLSSQVSFCLHESFGSNERFRHFLMHRPCTTNS